MSRTLTPRALPYRFTAPVLAFVLGLVMLLTAPAAEAQNYGVQNGDVLRIEVLEDPTLNRNVLVTPDGRISFPQVGTLSVRGRSVSTIQRTLTNRLAPNFASPPNVFVSVERLAPEEPAAPPAPEVPEVISVFIVGEAANTGELNVSPGTTALQMFGIMGGFSNFAATKRVQLRRTDPDTQAEELFTLNYRDIIAGKSGAGSMVLRDGDVIVVPQRRLFE